VWNHRELLDAAQAATGLTDFGDPSFLEGLEILVRSLREEARLNTRGEAMMRQRILTHLSQRLQIEDWYRRCPEIESVEVKAPLIGLSLPRTGSTALSFLLAEDPHARSLRRWEAAEPCPPPAVMHGEDSRIANATMAERSHPRAHTPSGAHGPAECQDLMALDFKAHIFVALAYVPTYAWWLINADLASTYLYQRRALKLLQWRSPEKPWRLKCPTHLIYLGYLNNAFPDARFVMTHRDPTEVMLSVCSVYADIMSAFTDEIDPRYIGKLNLEQWSIGMRRTLEFRDAGADARFYDIDFRAMHRDPIGEVRGLYEWLGEPVTEEFATGMARWWQYNSENREPREVADPARFGLEPEEIRPLFEEYAARIPAWTNRQRHIYMRGTT
jgi:Sulfotransferase family